jgi:quercetin dioxygenase-like cupin family protein
MKCYDIEGQTAIVTGASSGLGVCFYVIDGKGTFTVGDEQIHIGQGSMIFAPAGVARGIKSKAHND